MDAKCFRSCDSVALRRWFGCLKIRFVLHLVKSQMWSGVCICRRQSRMNR